MKKVTYKSAAIGRVVSIDARQQAFIRKEYPPGSQIPVGFYGGKWHIGSKPSNEDRQFIPDKPGEKR